MKKIVKNLLSWIKIKVLSQNELLGDLIIHEHALIEGSSLFGKIEVTEGCKIHYAFISGNVRIERFTSLWGPNISLNGNIIIGSFCSIGRNVTIQEYNHFTDRLTTYYIFKNVLNEAKNENTSLGSINIGSDVWIGANSTILSGVKIGNGAIIGANSLVNKNIPNYSIVAGNPAKIIKMRFSDEIIKKLDQIKWWDWPIEKIKKNAFLFEGVLTLETLQSISETD